MESGNYPHALYATDVKFRPAYRPSGRFTEQKIYFSTKHKLYGFKIECSVAPPGLAVDVSVLSPGSSSDLTIMLDRLHVHCQLLRKGGGGGGGTPRDGRGADTVPPDLGGARGQGLPGSGRVLHTIQPMKQPRGGTLDRDDIARNMAILSDRVLVENFL